MKRITLQVVRYWLPLLAWMAMIYYLSSVPNLRISPDTFVDLILRKLVHFSFFYILYFLSFRAFNIKVSRPQYWLPLIFSILYAFTDELHQRFVPTRSGNLTDWFIDVSGILFSYYMIRYRRIISVFNKYLNNDKKREVK